MDSCLACGAAGPIARKTRKGYDLASCTGCGLKWVQPIPTPEVLADYYSTNYRLAAHHERTNVAQAARDADLIQGWITRHAPAARSVCEVGCATGHLLAELGSRGYRVKGFELSSVTSEFAREKLGIDVTTGVLPADGPQFDVILMRHVLEHTPDPLDQIRTIEKRLAPGGLIILAVPNGSGAGFRLLGEFWTWYVPPAHLWYFTNRSLRRLLTDQGLSPVFEITRRGDANNLIMELGLGAARRVRASIAPPNSDELVPQSPETLPGSGWFRRGLSQITNLAAFPLELVLHPSGLGDELWLVARKTSE
jgi:SAM-dependent methyltransferase